jgi:hypothetical protein
MKCSNIPGSFTCNYPVQPFSSDDEKSADFSNFATVRTSTRVTSAQTIRTVVQTSRRWIYGPTALKRSTKMVASTPVTHIWSTQFQSTQVTQNPITSVAGIVSTSHFTSAVAPSPVTATTVAMTTGDVDECAWASVCQQGQCVNTPHSYYCQCYHGYTGVDCMLDINECELNPCNNSASCVNIAGNYYCVCTVGWTGEHCIVGKLLHRAEYNYVPTCVKEIFKCVR